MRQTILLLNGVLLAILLANSNLAQGEAMGQDYQWQESLAPRLVVKVHVYNDAENPVNDLVVRMLLSRIRQECEKEIWLIPVQASYQSLATQPDMSPRSVIETIRKKHSPAPGEISLVLTNQDYKEPDLMLPFTKIALSETQFLGYCDQGVIILYSVESSASLEDAGGHMLALTVLKHEIGHYCGLKHPRGYLSQRSIMHPYCAESTGQWSENEKEEIRKFKYSQWIPKLATAGN